MPTAPNSIIINIYIFLEHLSSYSRHIMNRSMYSVQVVIGEGGFGRVLSVMIGDKAFAVKEIDKVTNCL